MDTGAQVRSDGGIRLISLGKAVTAVRARHIGRILSPFPLLGLCWVEGTSWPLMSITSFSSPDFRGIFSLQMRKPSFKGVKPLAQDVPGYGREAVDRNSLR